MLKFFRKNADDFINILAFYIIGPAILLISILSCFDNPSNLFELKIIRSHTSISLVSGLVGLILTIRGITLLLKKKKD